MRARKNSSRPSDIFRFTNVWTIHLSFTLEQWEAMEPNLGAGPQFGARRGSFLQGPEGGRNGIAAAFGIVFDYVRADLEFGTNKFKDVGVRYKGNGTFLSSREGIKRSRPLHACLSFMPIFMRCAVQDISSSPLVAMFMTVSPWR